SVSLSQLRAELTAMELRLVDRLNGALAQKADRIIQEQISERVNKNDARLTILEQRAVTQDSPILGEIEELRQANLALSEVGKYKRWLWAQTFALAGISIGIIAFLVDHMTLGG
ncbi:MAG: hypothetical protein OEW47_12895, partial [Thermoleophilia bacterium]|nr:hypothetical protein [Thermoleophilia bacterium]